MAGLQLASPVARAPRPVLDAGALQPDPKVRVTTLDTSRPRAGLSHDVIDSVELPVAPDGRRTTGAPVRASAALTKPRIIELLLVTTAPVMFLADRGIPDAWLVL